MTSLALIINTFDQADYLSRVLAGVGRQSTAPEEVVLADDGSGEEIRGVFTRWTAGPGIRKEHVWQAHEGFRRARILNEAIARVRSDYLVFLDGDTIPHPQFVEDHRQLARRGGFVQGHRALLRESAAGWFGLGDFRDDRRRAFWGWQLEGLKHAFRWLRPLVRVRSDLHGIRGCNLGIWRENLVKANGYNEAFVGWGREDSELAVRLMNQGVKRLDVRGWAVCYHLWHPPASRDGLPANDELLEQAKRERATQCEAGLSRHVRTGTVNCGLGNLSTGS